MTNAASATEIAQMQRSSPLACPESAHLTSLPVTPAHDAPHRISPSSRRPCLVHHNSPTRAVLFSARATGESMPSQAVAPARTATPPAGAKIINPADLKSTPHAQFKGVEVCKLLTKADDNVDVTCTIVRWHPGAEIARHIHENSDDILYF